LIKSVGKGAVKAHLADGRDVVLPEGETANAYLERTSTGDLIVLNDDVTEVTKTEYKDRAPGGDDLIGLDEDIK